MKNIYLIASILFFSGVAAGSCKALNEAEKEMAYYLGDDTNAEKPVTSEAESIALFSSTAFVLGFNGYVRGYLDAKGAYKTPQEYQEKLNKIKEICLRLPILDYTEATNMGSQSFSL